MKRDDDLLREILFAYEEAEDWLSVEAATLAMDPESRRRHGHLLLLVDAGLVVRVGGDTYRLSNSGHDYLASIRDDGIWKKTKDTIHSVGGSVTLELVKQIALSFLHAKISEHTVLSL